MSGSGWNRGTGATKPAPQKKPGVMRGAIAGLAVVAVLGLAAFFIFGGKDAKPKAEKVEKKPAQLAEVKPAAAPKAKIEKIDSELENLIKHPELNSNRYVRLPDGRFLVPGRKKIHNVVTNYSNVGGEVAYKNGTEQVMLQIFSRQRGDMPLPLPSSLPKRDMEHLVEILISKDPPTEKDSEYMRASKEVIQVAKEEMIKYIKDGGDPMDFLRYYHNELEKSYQERKLAMQEVFNTARTEDYELAKQFCEEVNKRLEAKGIKKVTLPPQVKK